MMTVYFDNASTTRVRSEVRDIMVNMMCYEYGNPSSTHTLGRQAKAAVDSSRKIIAGALGAGEDELYFTSGGTEADNWAILGAAEAGVRRGRHIITSLSEHDAVRQTARHLESRGWEVTWLRPDKSGRITAEDFAAALRDDTVLASVMLVNNETGAVSPISEMTAEIRRRGLPCLFHTDAVQGFMKLPFTAAALGADLISVSAHKIHGPKGIGALYIKKGVKLPPLLFGGSQEREKRPGTESVPAVTGFAEAVRLAGLEQKETAERVRGIYDRTVSLLQEKLPGMVVLSPGDSPFILSLSLPGLKSEVLMNSLEAAGIYVSKSSACKKGARSHVLEAMKLPTEVIDGAVRISFSRESTEAEAECFVEKIAEAAQRLYKMARTRR
jgi:cysteine desulfurase